MTASRRVEVHRPIASGDGTPGGHRLAVVMPFARGTRYWLREVCGPGTRPEWDRGRGAWLVARPHFRKVVEALARRYGSCEVLVDHNVASMCGAWCRDAEGDECDCACMGENHGGQFWHRAWTKISAEWAVQHKVKRSRFHVTAADVRAPSSKATAGAPSASQGAPPPGR